MAGVVNVPSSTRNRPAAVQRFQPIHDPGKIFDDGQITARQFAQHAHPILATCGLSKSYNQAAQVPSSKVTDKVPRSPPKNSRMVEAFVSRMDSMINLPIESITATEIVA